MNKEFIITCLEEHRKWYDENDPYDKQHLQDIDEQIKELQKQRFCKICGIQDGNPFLCGNCQWHRFMEFCTFWKERHGNEFQTPVYPTETETMVNKDDTEIGTTKTISKAEIQ